MPPSLLQGLRSLFGTLMLSLPAFWNVGGLLALMFFIYAYIGMLLLGHVKRNGWVGLS
jgi:quinol-cytochrome oxidoreductase complex cytochrome b subunit